MKIADIILALPDKPEAGEKYGRKYCQTAKAVVTFDNGLTVESVIWAGLETDKTSKDVSVTFSPGIPRGVKFSTEEQLEEFQSIILEHAQVWNLFPSLCDKAEFRLTNTAKAPAKSGKLVRKVVNNIVDNSLPETVTADNSLPTPEPTE